MLFGPNDIRQLCIRIVEANQTSDDAKVRELVRELQFAIRSQIQQTRVMAAHAVRRSFLKSSGSIEESQNGSNWPYGGRERHDNSPAGR
jgi:hypothetical protein